MPKAKKQPVPPVAPEAPYPPEPTQAPPTTPTDDARTLQVIYEKLDVTEFSTATERGPLTVEEMKDILGWETESQYKERKVREDTAKGKENCKPEHYIYGEDYHCKNLAGEKVRCTNNLNNRPFDEKWSEDLEHTVLAGQWAGPHTIPGETVNGETIRISRYGRVISGQHQMTGAIKADEKLQRDRANGMDTPEAPKYPAWVGHEHVFIETIVVTGMSEDPRVLMTVDYVKPRSVADVFYTSSVFKDASRQDRQELCRILERACDFLWTRTDARGYRTHLEIVGFLERHPRLLDCVLHLFKLNRATKVGGRKISNLRLSPGQCAALMYIMGSAGEKTDGDEYRNMDPAPSEKNERGRDALDWSYWDRAESFWTNLVGAGPNPTLFMQVRIALGQLVTSSVDSEDNLGMGGRLGEKLAILAKAWERWKDHPDTAGAPFDNNDLLADGCLFLTYVDYDSDGKKLPDGRIELVDLADFMGIDCPQVKKSTNVSRNEKPDEKVEYTKEEMERMKEEALARRSTAATAKK